MGPAASQSLEHRWRQADARLSAVWAVAATSDARRTHANTYREALSTMEAWGEDSLSNSAAAMAAPPDALVVDLVLHRELRAEAQVLQEELNDRKTERLSKQAKFDQLQMSLQVIACEKAPTTATEVRVRAPPKPTIAPARSPPRELLPHVSDTDGHAARTDGGVSAASVVGNRAGHPGGNEVRHRAAEHDLVCEGRAKNSAAGEQWCAETLPASLLVCSSARLSPARRHLTIFWCCVRSCATSPGPVEA